MNLLRNTALAATLVVLFAAPASAAVVVDDDGMGFVGKGDIQMIYDWNNKELQKCVGMTGTSGCLSFRMVSTSVTESTWTCTRDAGTQTHEHSQTTTTTTQWIVATTARFKNQVTGFNLNGVDPDSLATTATTTVGLQQGSCPTAWSQSDLVITALPGGDLALEVSNDSVSNDSGTWKPLPLTP